MDVVRWDRHGRGGLHGCVRSRNIGRLLGCLSDIGLGLGRFCCPHNGVLCRGDDVLSTACRRHLRRRHYTIPIYSGDCGGCNGQVLEEQPFSHLHRHVRCRVLYERTAVAAVRLSTIPHIVVPTGSEHSVTLLVVYHMEYAGDFACVFHWSEDDRQGQGNKISLTAQTLQRLRTLCVHDRDRESERASERERLRTKNTEKVQQESTRAQTTQKRLQNGHFGRFTYYSLPEQQKVGNAHYKPVVNMALHFIPIDFHHARYHSLVSTEQAPDLREGLDYYVW